jgi:hypothetical protein
LFCDLFLGLIRKPVVFEFVYDSIDSFKLSLPMLFNDIFPHLRLSISLGLLLRLLLDGSTNGHLERYIISVAEGKGVGIIVKVVLIAIFIIVDLCPCGISKQLVKVYLLLVVFVFMDVTLIYLIVCLVQRNVG